MSTAYQYLFNKSDVVLSGLLVEQTLAPLNFLGAQISVEIQHYCARVQVEHHYRNAESRNLAAVYVFPVEENWAISGFTAKTAKKTIRAKMKPRERMHKEFRDSVFTVSIPGPIKPEETITTTITFLVELSTVPTTNELRFVLNNSVLPPHREKEITEWAEAFRVPTQQQVARSVHIDVHCAMYFPINSIHCPSHRMVLNVNESEAFGSFEESFGPREAILMKDPLVIDIEVADPRDFMKVVVVKEVGTMPNSNTHALCIPIVPRFTDEDAAAPNTELVFMLDCSGSMVQSMHHVERAVKLCLQGLPHSLRFNVVLFGDTYKMLDEQACLPFNDDNLMWARSYVHNLQADMGGTNMFSAFEAVYKTTIERGYCRQVFLITDGSTNEPFDVLRLVKFNAHNTRVFVFGVDTPHTDCEVLGRLAECSRGRATFIESAVDLSQPLLRTLEEALQPALTKTTVTYAYEGNAHREHAEPLPPIQNTVETLPLLFNKSRYVLYAFGGEELAPNPVVLLTAWVGKKQFEWMYHVGDMSGVLVNDRPGGEPGNMSTAHCVAAQRRIAELVEFNTKSSLTSAEEKEVVLLSMSCNIISPYTCFVAEAVNADSGATWNQDHVTKEEIANEYNYYLPRDDSNTKKVNRPKPTAPKSMVEKTNGSIRPQKSRDNRVARKQPKAPSTMDFMHGIVLDVVHSLCRTPVIDDILFAQSAAGHWVMSPRFAQSIDLSYATLTSASPVVQPEVPLDVPAIRERDRQMEEERRRAEEEEVEVRQREEEVAIRKAQRELERQKKLGEERAKMSVEELATLEETDRRKHEEDGEKQRSEQEKVEKERRERDKEIERDKKKRDAERRKLVKKLGEEAVRHQEEEEKRKEAHERDRLKREEEAALKREEDVRRMWEARERRKYIQNIWATAVALAYLDLQYPTQIHEFQLASRRGRRWLHQIGVPDSVKWLQQAATFLQPLLDERHSLATREREEARKLEQENRLRYAQERDRAEEESERQRLTSAAMDRERARLQEEEHLRTDTYSSDEETEDGRREALAAIAEQERQLAEMQHQVEEEPHIAEAEGDVDDQDDEDDPELAEDEGDVEVDEDNMPEDEMEQEGEDDEVEEEEDIEEEEE